MKTVYIAHPLASGDSVIRTLNRNIITHIVKDIVANEPDVCPLSPIHNFSYLPDDNPTADARARELCKHFITLADELRVFGDWVPSEGCQMEIEIARELGIPIVYEDGTVEGGSTDAD